MISNLKMKKDKIKSKKTVEDKVVKPSTEAPRYDDSEWPLLLKNFHKMNIREGHFTPSTKGYSPLQRPIEEYLKSGVINLDKTANPSSHEEVAWVKRIIGCEKTGHSGTLDPKVTGCLIVCLDRATRLVKSQQNSGKEYIAVLKLTKPVADFKTLDKILDDYRGALYQWPPVICAVKRQLRQRTIHDINLMEYDATLGKAILWVKCQAGTYIRTLCTNIGLTLGSTCYMDELRRIRSGLLTENDNLVTLHDIKDAMFMLREHNDESYIRRVVMPLEILLTCHKRIMVKDSTICALTFGAQIMLPGVLRFDNDIHVGDEIVVISTKGEAVALALAQMTTSTMTSCDHGIVAKLKRVIMERELYDRQWGKGPHATNAKIKKAIVLANKAAPDAKSESINSEPVTKKLKLDLSTVNPAPVPKTPIDQSDSDSSDSD